MMQKGASFCHVERTSPVMRSSPWRTSGNQECRGAIPILKANEIKIRIVGRSVDIWLISHCPVIQALVIAQNRIVAAAGA